MFGLVLPLLLLTTGVTFRGSSWGVKILIVTNAPRIALRYEPKTARIALQGAAVGGLLRGTAALEPPDAIGEPPRLRLDPALEQKLRSRGVKVLAGGYSHASQCCWVEAAVPLFGKLSVVLPRTSPDAPGEPAWA